jgi:cobalt/nickel transport system ATP-binding protein
VGSSGPVFTARDVGFVYPDETIGLRSVSFEIGAGERVALLGANGSGKSTLLRLLGALAVPTSGDLTAFERPMARVAEDDTEARAFRRRVQFVFQNADAQLFSPTVEEEIAFGPLQLYDGNDVRERVDTVLKATRIEHLRDRPPHRLSGGEKRKVALASVLVLEPEVLLLDEPTAGLDPRSVGWLIETLDAFAAGGGTVVIATQEIPLLGELADRAMVIGEDHCLAFDGTVGDVLADRELLERCNLVHRHRHRHGEQVHDHPHEHR